nr:hypothetical protein [Tanacetum cinerariifolium]
ENSGENSESLNGPLALAVGFWMGFHLMDPDEFEASQSPEQAPSSPDYVPGPEYLKNLALSDDEIPIEDQPLATDALPNALSLGYVADFDPLEEDPEEDPKDDLVDYHADVKDDDEEEEAFEEDEDKEEEHLDPVDSATLSAIDPVPSAEETKLFEIDESAATPPPPP